MYDQTIHILIIIVIINRPRAHEYIINLATQRRSNSSTRVPSDIFQHQSRLRTLPHALVHPLLLFCLEKRAVHRSRCWILLNKLPSFLCTDTVYAKQHPGPSFLNGNKSRFGVEELELVKSDEVRLGWFTMTKLFLEFEKVVAFYVFGWEDIE